MFSSVCLVQARSTAAFSGWPREERTKLQIPHKHPAVRNFFRGGGEELGARKPAAMVHGWMETGRAPLIFLLDRFLGNSQSAWPVSPLWGQLMK